MATDLPSELDFLTSMSQMGGALGHCFSGDMLKNTGRQGSILSGPRKGIKTCGHKCPTHLSHKCPILIFHYVLLSMCEILNNDVLVVLVLPHSTHNVCAGSGL